MKKLFNMALVSLTFAMMLSGCGSTPAPAPTAEATTDATMESESTLSGTININGSSALLPFAQFLAEDFQSNNPNVSITLNGGGSGTGLKDVAAKSVDIGMSDVYAEDKLPASAAESLVDHKVCTTGVGVIANKGIGIEDIKKEDLKKIFDGSVTNWKEIGGADLPIIIVNRPATSGTRALFIKFGLDKGEIVEGDNSLQTDDSSALAKNIAETDGAIGYLGFAYLNKADQQYMTLKLDGIEATNENVYNNTYPIWGFEHMYTNGEATDPAKSFIEHANDPDMIIAYEKMGYGSVSKLNAEAAQSR